MQTLSYTEIENATDDDIGKVALTNIGGPTLAIEDTLEECLEIAALCGIEQFDDSVPGEYRPIVATDVDCQTDLRYLKCGDLVAVIIGNPEAE